MKRILFFILIILSAKLSSAQVLDRSKRPKAGPPPVITLKDPATFKLPNGLTVLVVENHKLPKISASLNIDAGPKGEGAKAGANAMMGAMLNEGTTDHDKLQFDQAVDQLGADLSLSANGGSVAALSRYFEPAFGLMGEGLRKPLFAQASFDKVKSQVIANLKSSERSATTISRRVVNALQYGSTHPMGEFLSEKSVGSVNLNDIKSAYNQSITPSRAYLTFVGDIDVATARKLAIKVLGDWKGVALAKPAVPAVANLQKSEIDVIDVPNAVQSEITVTNIINLPLNSPDYHAVLLANEILGGGSDAKLFRNLREKHAFTYGAYSKAGAGRFPSSFSATTAVRNEKVDSAIVEILNEIKIMRTEKVSEDVLSDTKNLYNGNFALGLEDPARIAGFASSILINELPKDFYRTYLQKINAVTTADILRVSQKYFGEANSRIVVVGKKVDFFAQLKRLNLPVKEFDIYAQPK